MRAPSPLHLARGWYVVLAAVLAWRALDPVVEAALIGCRAIPNVDGAPGGATLLLCPGAVDPTAFAMAAAAALGAGAAAAWVRSSGLVRGALASFGIAVGLLTSLAPIAITVAISGVLGALWWAWPLAGAVAVIGLASAAVMWRASARPWDRPRVASGQPEIAR